MTTADVVEPKRSLGTSLNQKKSGVWRTSGFFLSAQEKHTSEVDGSLGSIVVGLVWVRGVETSSSDKEQVKVVRSTSYAALEVV